MLHPAHGDAGRGRLAVRCGLLCGLLAPVLWAAVIWLAGELRPGFDHVDQYISELAERGGSTAGLMRYGGFLATGLLHIAFAAALYVQLQRLADRRWLSVLVALLVALNGIGRIAAGWFACEPGCGSPDVLEQRLHNGAATLAFLAIVAATLLGALLFRSAPRLRPLGLFSLGSGCAGLIFLGLLTASGPSGAASGLYERLASGVLSLWVFVVAAWLWTQPRRERAAS